MRQRRGGPTRCRRARSRWWSSSACHLVTARPRCQRTPTSGRTDRTHVRPSARRTEVSFIATAPITGRRHGDCWPNWSAFSTRPSRTMRPSGSPATSISAWRGPASLGRRPCLLKSRPGSHAPSRACARGSSSASVSSACSSTLARSGEWPQMLSGRRGTGRVLRSNGASRDGTGRAQR